MDYFSGLVQEHSRRTLVAVMISTACHLLSILLIVLLPMLRARSIDSDHVVDVTLFDYALPELGSDIVPAAVSIEKPKPAEPPKPVPKNELVDPSDAELKRMKNREKDRTPPPKAATEEEFAMQSDLLPGGGGQTMGSMRVDAKDFPFLYYLAMMKSKVSENWIPPFGSFEAENKRVVISFRIDRQGRLLASGIEETSGDTILDQSALRAVIVSAPFPSLPEGYSDSSLGVHFGFICKL
ncbi:TonB family protein [bacterium]|nr:TonB family protein [candidate division CSSED10-310 bacterium]